jgi:putative heme-binding domain-containing protein
VIATEPAARALALLVGDAAQPFGWRKRLAEVAFGGRDGALSQFETEVWAGAPHRFQVALARGLAAETPRAAQLVFAMRDGKAPTGLLQDRALRERMRRLEHSEARQALEALEASLPDEDAAAQQLLEQRRAAFARAKPSPERGREVFALACAVCHKIGSEGGTVGPQLTGIGTRGAERLSEDILVPNRNLDHAFFTTVLELSDGESVSGLFRREEGESIVLATAAGTEFSVPKADVVERRETRVSIMPSNFGEALSEEQFADLLGFLLEQKGTN